VREEWVWKLRRGWRWVKRLRVTTKMGTLQMERLYAERQAQEAKAKLREVERFLVLLSEPLKDWDLADFPTTGPEADRHLKAIVEAYRLTATKVAPIRANRVLDDRARGRGWDDQPITTTHPDWRLH